MTAPAPLQLHVLTLNCWGIPLVSRDRRARMAAIGQAIAAAGYDLAGLQEIFLEEDRATVAQAAGLPHARYFPSGPMGSGLFILSRFPIVESDYLRFRLNGRPQELVRIDYYAGKGVARARLDTPAGPLDFYNTHLVAPYLEIGPDYFYGHRVAQAYETAHYIVERSAGVPALLMGDLNTSPGSLVYRICTGFAGLVDLFRAANPDDPCFTVTAENPYLVAFDTSNCADYLLARDGADVHFRVLSAEVVLDSTPEALRDRMQAYSDHYGVAATLELGQSAAEAGPAARPPAWDDLKTALMEGFVRARRDQMNAGLGSAFAGAAAGILLALRGKTNPNRLDFLRAVAAAIAAVLALAAGVQLTRVASLEGEARAFRALLEEIEARRPA